MYIVDDVIAELLRISSCDTSFLLSQTLAHKFAIFSQHVVCFRLSIGLQKAKGLISHTSAKNPA
jgi:hypothetical protein